MTHSPRRNLEKVSCKAALFNKNRTKVLLIEFLPGRYSLPGGHTEPNELPEDTMRRELREELGITEDVGLKKRDFWRHSDGKIVLGFVGEMSEDIEIFINKDEIEAAVWTSISDIESGNRTAGMFDAFILGVVG